MTVDERCKTYGAVCKSARPVFCCRPAGSSKGTASHFIAVQFALADEIVFVVITTVRTIRAEVVVTKEV